MTSFRIQPSRLSTMKRSTQKEQTSRAGCSQSCAIFLSTTTVAATIVDTTDNLYHLNLSQDSGIDSPEDSYSASEIHDAINSFSEEYRVPFSMHVAGYKYNEIADHLGLPLGTVKSRIFMARKRLQERFADYR